MVRCRVGAVVQRSVGGSWVLAQVQGRFAGFHSRTSSKTPELGQINARVVFSTLKTGGRHSHRSMTAQEAGSQQRAPSSRGHRGCSRQHDPNNQQRVLCSNMQGAAPPCRTEAGFNVCTADQDTPGIELGMSAAVGRGVRTGDGVRVDLSPELGPQVWGDCLVEPPAGHTARRVKGTAQDDGADLEMARVRLEEPNFGFTPAHLLVLLPRRLSLWHIFVHFWPFPTSLGRLMCPQNHKTTKPQNRHKTG